MSLYNMMNGVNWTAFLCLPVLGKHPDEYPRFRDSFVGIEGRPEFDGKIVLLTRTGGNNREDYQDEIDEMYSMPTFIADFDDDFDNTYAYWVFDIPEEWKKDFLLVMDRKFTEVSQGYVDMVSKVYPKVEAQIRAIFSGEDPGKLKKDEEKE